MRCCDVEALWDAMRTGDGPQDEIALAHLRRCRTCQSVYEEFEGVAYCLTCLPIVEPPASLVPRILEHVAALRSVLRAQAPDEFARIASPLGDLVVAWSARGISFVGIDLGEPAESQHRRIERRLRKRIREAEPPAWVRETLASFFAAWQADFERIDVSALSPFEQAALRKAAQIPPGEVRSYGWIAREIGHPHAARAVGQAMARNPVALLFPCHRVVDATGALHNYGYGVELKARILHMEGYEPRAVATTKRGASRRG